MTWVLTIADPLGVLQQTITDATTPPVMIDHPVAEVGPRGDCRTMTLRGLQTSLAVPRRGILSYAEDGNPLFWGVTVVLPSDASKGAGPADQDADALNRFTVFGGKQLLKDSVVENYLLGGNATAITGATNASPIQITTAAAHGLSTGAQVLIQGVQGNDAANGNWPITVTGSTTFTLDGSTGSGAYTSGGTMSPAGYDAVMDVSEIALALCLRYAHPALTIDAANFPSVGFNLSTFYEPERKLSDALDDLAKTVPNGAVWYVDASGAVHFEAA